MEIFIPVRKYEVANWNKWIFEIKSSYLSFKRCALLCFLNADCDYFVFTDEFCYFGSFNYFGDGISVENATTEISTIYMKIGIENDTAPSHRY